MDTQAYAFGAKLVSEFDNDVKVIFNSYNYNEKISFIRGYFDTNGSVVQSMTNPKCTLRSVDLELRKVIKELIQIPCNDTDKGIEYNHINVIEFLHILYKNADCVDYNCNYATYRSLLYCWEPNFQNDILSRKNAYTYRGEGMFFKFSKTLNNAVPPKKAHVTDTGYDLCLVEKVKEENGMIMYDTGIAVQPPLGYYFELVGRSSISKTGYIVANSIGIIDASYTGSLKVALIKINKDAPELELPARLVQLIPRQLVHLDAIEVQNLNNTTRAEGGFGSSGSGIMN
jgi:deoxyuridine 5'-triphosphate nucleotidohydrolase